MDPIKWRFRDSEHDTDLYCTDIPDALFDEDDGLEEDSSDSVDFSDDESVAEEFSVDGSDEYPEYDDGDFEEFDRNNFYIPDVTDDDIPQSMPHKPASTSKKPPKDSFARMCWSCILEALALVIIPVNSIEKQRYCDPDDFFGFTPALVSISFGLIYACIVFYFWATDGSEKPLVRRVIDNLKTYRLLFVILAIIPAIFFCGEVNKSIKLHSAYMEAVDLVIEQKWYDAKLIICDPDIYYDNFTDAQSLWGLAQGCKYYEDGDLQWAYNEIYGQTFEKTPPSKRTILYGYANWIAAKFTEKYPDGEATFINHHKPRYTESTYHHYGGGGGGMTTTTTRRTTGWTTKPTTRYTTRRTGTATTEYDRFEASEYSTAEDFYYENYYDFFDYYEAEDYYNEHHG